MPRERLVAYEFGSFGEIAEFIEFLAENGIGYYQNFMMVIVSQEAEGECNDFFYMVSERDDIKNLREIDEEVAEEHIGTIL